MKTSSLLIHDHHDKKVPSESAELSVNILKVLLTFLHFLPYKKLWSWKSRKRQFKIPQNECNSQKWLTSGYSLQFQYVILQQSYENRQAYQLPGVIYSINWILLSILPGNVRQSVGRITYLILGLKGFSRFVANISISFTILLLVECCLT